MSNLKAVMTFEQIGDEAMVCCIDLPTSESFMAHMYIKCLEDQCKVAKEALVELSLMKAKAEGVSDKDLVHVVNKISMQEVFKYMQHEQAIRTEVNNG